MPSGKVLAADWANIVQTVYADVFPVALNRISFIWSRLAELGKVRQINRNNIDWRVNSAGHGNVTAIDDGETLPSPGKQTVVNPQLQFKILIATISVGRQVQRASFAADSSVADALAWETQRTIEDMAREIHLDLVGSAASTKNITGLQDALNASNTYAGIARGANTFWQPYVNDNGGTDRALTEALLEDVVDTLKTQRGARISEAWCGVTAWNALRQLIYTTLAPARNNTPERLAAGAMALEWEGIRFVKVPDYDLNRIDFVDLDSEGGIEYLVQSDQDFMVAPEATDSFDTRVSITHMSQLVCWNPFKQGSLQDVE